ncbi:MAG: 3-deoxy-7-phosphoheptulonate synthase, partial [Planctomycetaceae bacterium]|nr:3-deoxy-7-phosphoheptulonate synthase [Planctomycetaceae bacterium]
MHSTQDINIRGTTPLTAPRQLKLEQPASDACYELVTKFREDVKQILEGTDHRLIVVVGPCSIHNRESGLEYAR